MILRATGMAVIAATLAGCMSMAPQSSKLIWVRADGQSGRDNPALARQYEADSTGCIADAEKATGINNPQAPAVVNWARQCMTQRGYVLVPADQAAAKAAELRAKAKPAGT